jgi:hypothetical protein
VCVGEVGKEEDKAPVVVGQKEPLIFFTFNNRTNLLDFSRTKDNEFLNSVLTKILKMKASFFRIFISKFLIFFEIFKFNRLVFGEPTKPDLVLTWRVFIRFVNYSF